MSPRAACRLETLGFTQVHDYVPGKVDWLAHNLPVQGTATAVANTIGANLRHDVVIAAPDEHIADVRARVAASRYGFALVTTQDVTLLGRLRRSTLDTANPALPAGEVMEPGPSTLRPHEPVADVAARLHERDLTYAIVTDPEGHLLGTVYRADLG
jgi:CBS domain-containing protein